MMVQQQFALALGQYILGHTFVYAALPGVVRVMLQLFFFAVGLVRVWKILNLKVGKEWERLGAVTGYQGPCGAIQAHVE